MLAPIGGGVGARGRGRGASERGPPGGEETRTSVGGARKTQGDDGYLVFAPPPLFGERARRERNGKYEAARGGGEEELGGLGTGEALL